MIDNQSQSTTVSLFVVTNQDDLFRVSSGIGFSLVTQSRIILTVKPGVAIPERLSSCIDCFVEFTSNVDELTNRVMAAIVDLGACGCDMCRKDYRQFLASTLQHFEANNG